MEERGGLNLYALTGNDLLNYWDLLGLSTSNCTSVSFSVSYNLANRSFPTPVPFIFVGVSGDINVSVSGQKCDECCSDGTTADYFDVSASVSGSSTLTITAGINFAQSYGGFSVDVWGGVQGSGGGSISGSGSFSDGCNGPTGTGTGALAGNAGLRVGAEASFRAGRWSLGTTGVSGGGNVGVDLPFTFSCDGDGCTSPSWGSPTTSASLSVSACLLGFCFAHTF